MKPHSLIEAVASGSDPRLLLQESAPSVVQEMEAVRRDLAKAEMALFVLLHRAPPHPSLQETKESLHRAILAAATYSTYLSHKT